MRTHYDELGISSSASTDGVRVAFKRRALVVHPDKGGSKDAFQRAMLAFEVLSDRAARLRYDRCLGISMACAKHVDNTGGVACQHVPATRSHVSSKRSSKGESCRTMRRKSDVQGSVEGIPQVPVNAKAVFSPASSHTNFSAASSGDSTVAQPETMSHKPTTETRASQPLQSKQQQISFRLSETLKCVFHHMQRLDVQKRRCVIETWLTQAQRLEMEAFALTQASASLHEAFYIVPSRCQDDSSSESDTACISDISEETVVKHPCKMLPWSSLPETCSADVVGSHPAVSRPAVVGEYPGSVEEVAEYMMLEDGTASSGVSFTGEQFEHVDEIVPSLRTPLPRGQSSVRGLYTRRDRSDGAQCGYSYYSAGICIAQVQITTRKVRELSSALDWLLILSEIKQRFQDCSEGTCTGRLQAVFEETLRDHGTTSDKLGLSFSLQISKKFWVGSLLSTPCVHDLGTILNAVEQLAPYQGRVGVTNQALLAQTGWSKLEAEWSCFKKVFVEVCGTLGQCQRQLTSFIAQKEHAHRHLREAALDWWNTRRMACEEKIQRRAEKEERTRERKNRRAMLREDRHSAKVLHYQLFQEERVLRSLRRLIRRWLRLSEQHYLLNTRARLKQRAQEVKDQKAKTLLAARAKQDQSRQRRKEREERWKAMNSQNLTMSDIMTMQQEPFGRHHAHRPNVYK